MGLRAETSAIAAHAGIMRITEHPFMVDRAGDPYRVAMVRSIKAADRAERLFELAAPALEEALEPLPTKPGAQLPVFLGLPELGPGFTQADADILCRRLATHVVDRCAAEVVGIPDGNAAGVVALERARAIASSPQGAQYFIVGGVDSWMHPDLLQRLDDGGRLKSITNRWGFPPGEGAAMLGMCTNTVGRQSGSKVLGMVHATAVATESASMGVEAICTGEALATVVRTTAQQAGGKITLQLCDMDGDRYREHEYSHALMRVHPDLFLNAIDYVAPAGAWGQVGAATAPLLMTLAVAREARGFPCGPWPMIWCGSENGRRGAVVLNV